MYPCVVYARDCSALSWICSSVRICSLLKVLIEPRVAPTKRAPYAEHGSSKTEVHSEVFFNHFLQKSSTIISVLRSFHKGVSEMS